MSISMSPLERVTQWLHRRRVSPILASAMLAVCMAAIAAYVGVHLHRQYLAFTLYYPDSSAYRLRAVLVYQALKASGLAAALWQALALKDGLDVTVRLLLWPDMLGRRFGHMVALIPYMSGFMFLTIWYVFRRTESLMAGAVTAATLFTAGLIYGPFVGIADYWKDSLGCWLMGSACLTWLLAERLSRPRWSFLCGMCLGLLVMQRTSAAVYLAPLFAVPFLAAAYQRVREDGWRRALPRVSVFVGPPLVLTVLVMAFQFQTLHKYYFGVGYFYGSSWFIARTLADNMLTYGGAMLYVVPAIGLVCVLTIARWRDQLGDVATAIWFAAGLPAVIVLTGSGFVPGFYACLSVLLVVLLATMVPRVRPGTTGHVLVTVALILIGLGAARQYARSTVLARPADTSLLARRAFAVQIAKLLLAQPEPRIYKLIFSEAGVDLWNLAYFDIDRAKALTLHESDAFVSVHDSYYRAVFGDLTADKIARLDVERLERITGTIVVAHCTPDDVRKQYWFTPNPRVPFLATGNPVARTVAIQLGEHVRGSAHWKAITKFDSPDGCLYAYQYSPHPLSMVAKWQDLASSRPLLEIPFALALGPGARMYQYTSRYAPELWNGVYWQWLPSGEDGLRIAVFTARPGAAVFQARVVPGPSRTDPARTLAVSIGLQKKLVTITGERDIQVPLGLQAGLNDITFAVQEPADRTFAGDRRELLLALISPRLVPAGD